MRGAIPLADCLKWLRGYEQPRDQPPLVAVLIQQLNSFKTDPVGMRPAILRTIEAIKGPSA